MQKADENIVAKWISQSIEWAGSDAVGPGQAALAMSIAQTLPHVQVRPFYTPEELSLMFPSIASSLQMGRGKVAAPANVLAQELIQMGIEYLRCEENLDGFIDGGQVKQYLIISNPEEFVRPITQLEFEKLMETYPKYRDWRRAKSAANKKRGVKRKK